MDPLECILPLIVRHTRRQMRRQVMHPIKERIQTYEVGGKSVGARNGDDPVTIWRSASYEGDATQEPGHPAINSSMKRQQLEGSDDKHTIPPPSIVSES